MGKVIEIPEEIAVLIRTLIPKSLLARLHQQATAEGRPAGELLIEALVEKLGNTDAPMTHDLATPHGECIHAKPSK